jgi:integration host factor subunit alpha
LTVFSCRGTVLQLKKEVGSAAVSDTITRAQLTEAVYQEVGLSRNESADLVESVLSEMSDALIRGEMVKLSSFGSFQVRQKGQRMGRNPKTGEEVPILPRRVLVFRPSHVLKKRINETADDVREPETATGYAAGGQVSGSETSY